MPQEMQTPVLRFENVTVAFDDVTALSDISFDLAAKEARIILGAAGSGKTVLLKTALGLVKPESGRVFAFDKDISTMSERELYAIRGRMGMLFKKVRSLIR